MRNSEGVHSAGPGRRGAELSAMLAVKPLGERNLYRGIQSAAHRLRRQELDPVRACEPLSHARRMSGARGLRLVRMSGDGSGRHGGDQRMGSRRVNQALIVLFVLGVAAWAYHAVRSGSSGGPAVPQDHELKGLATAAEEQVLAEHTVASLEPAGSEGMEAAGASHPSSLPSVDLPLGEQIESLEREAAKGNGQAVCRLLRLTSRCREMAASASFDAALFAALQSAPGRHDEWLIRWLASSAERFSEVGASCEGMRADQLRSESSILTQFRGALTPRQKTILALTNSDGSLRRLHMPRMRSQSGAYVIPQLLADNTHAFLLEGFRARDPLALEGLLLLHAPSSALGPGFVSVWLPNPSLYLYYFGILARVAPPEFLTRDAVQTAQLSATALGTVEVARINAESERAARSWLAARQAQSQHSPQSDRRAGQWTIEDDC